MGRSPCCEQAHTNKGAWTKEEDQRLIAYIKAHGEGCWRSLPKAAGLLRCGKSCRLRWINYLRPDLKRGNFTEEEDELIIKFHELFGNKWSLIAGRLPGRTDNEIKNYWNTHIKRKLLSRGIDPQTHRALNAATAVAGSPAQQQHQQHYQLQAQKLQLAAAPGLHQQQDHVGAVLSTSPEACSHSSDDERRSVTPTPPRRHLDIDLNLSISLAPYQPPEEYSSEPLKQEAPPATAAGSNAAVCLCLNSLGFRPGVECVCGGAAAASSRQEHWARNLLQAAPCHRGQV
ncbi:hypothetical protein ACP4OV_014645 [Aristida adscensionis]